MYCPGAGQNADATNPVSRRGLCGPERLFRYKLFAPVAKTSQHSCTTNPTLLVFQ